MNLRVWSSVTMVRGYKDRDDNLQQSTSFNSEDLLTVAKFADLAHCEIAHLRRSDRLAQAKQGSEG